MAQLLPGIDNTILFIVVVLIIVLVPAALLLRRTLAARAREEGRSRRQRLDYQPGVRPIPVSTPLPVAIPARKPHPVTAPVAGVLAECRDIQESLAALVAGYSLESFTIATSDGLVFASSGGSTAQEDAARFSRNYDIRESAGIALFSLDHKGSELTGIIRSHGIITGEIQKRIENDTKDILNRWI